MGSQRDTTEHARTVFNSLLPTSNLNSKLKKLTNKINFKIKLDVRINVKLFTRVKIKTPIWQVPNKKKNPIVPKYYIFYLNINFNITVNFYIFLYLFMYVLLLIT